MPTIERYASVKTLTALALAGKDRRDWYTEQGAYLRGVADANGWDADLFIDIIALTSPRQTVAGNLRLTTAIMVCLDNGSRLHHVAATVSGLMPSIRASLVNYSNDGRIRGPKTSRFAANLKGDHSVATLDVHMAYALATSKYQRSWLAGRLTGKRYARLEARIQAVARKLGWTTAQVQAAIWTTVTREKGIRTGTFSA